MLDTPFYENDATTTRLDRLTAPDEEQTHVIAFRRITSQLLRSELRRLSLRQQHILSLRYGLEDDVVRTIAGVSAIVRLSTSRVYQLEQSALAALRRRLRLLPD